MMLIKVLTSIINLKFIKEISEDLSLRDDCCHTNSHSAAEKPPLRMFTMEPKIPRPDVQGSLLSSTPFWLYFDSYTSGELNLLSPRINVLVS